MVPETEVKTIFKHCRTWIVEEPSRRILLTFYYENLQPYIKVEKHHNEAQYTLHQHQQLVTISNLINVNFNIMIEDTGRSCGTGTVGAGHRNRKGMGGPFPLGKEEAEF